MKWGTWCVVFLAACDPAPMGMPDLGPMYPNLEAIEPEPQRPGDPAAGYQALVGNGYVSCGVPWSLYSQFFGTSAPAADRLPGRTGRNAMLPYNQTAFTTKSGVEVVSANCLQCHAGRLNGELVVGLGATDVDYTSAGATAQQLEIAVQLATDPKEKAELQKFADRMAAVGGYTTTRTIGVNPADNLAAVLFAHRDRKTLAWSNTPLLELPPEIVVPVDVPPWWRMKKKHALFYVAAGRGDHARIEMSASALCTDSVDEARAIDAYFDDVRAYLASIEPPRWPFPLDRALADAGKLVFEQTCAVCHGTYGASPRYHNLVVPLDVIGTDPSLALGAAQFADRFIAWFNESFYGETARLEPEEGYVAPPLDGVWATAPYLHNGSVPSIALLLDSTKRPRYFTRSFDSSDYDPDTLGWRFTALDHGQDAEPDAQARKRIYDTTQLGYANTGHTFGDHLDDAARRAVLEYLKTL
jgi:mono/diheme cytochrome c family protein